MLEKPDLSEDRIVGCLRENYGLWIDQISFLPLGADRNTAVYRASKDSSVFFVKLRRGVFNEIVVTLPSYLRNQGIHPIISPMETQTGHLWTRLEPFNLVLYPFVEGKDGYEVVLSDHQWTEFGAAVQRIHTTVLPATLAIHLPRESYSPKGRETVKSFLRRVMNGEAFADPTAAKLAAFLEVKYQVILELVERADQLARRLQARPPEFVLCHSDLHAGNLLIDSGGEEFYIVDWDDPILAPKERDLMFIGGAQGFLGCSPEQEEILFYRGYGAVQVDPFALAYYRYERIIQDIAVFCKQLFMTKTGGEDREQSLRYLISNFRPNGTIEIAYCSDKTRR